MDRTLDVRTPESIAFSFELAGIGSRFLAVAIDIALQLAILALFLWGLVLVGAHGSPSHVKAASGEERFWYSVAQGVFAFVVFAIFFGYFILFEALWNGQTPGKRALGLRVIRDGGYPLDFTASLVRNVVRIGELGFGLYAISGIVALLSSQNKRVGDFAAGTIVVRDSRMERPESSKGLAGEPDYASTAYVSGEERGLIKRFLERRHSLEPERRSALAAQIAERIRPRLPTDMARLDDESLLERL
jgi:uncharacterized RDD family membrane protein YckC